MTDTLKFCDRIAEEKANAEFLTACKSDDLSKKTSFDKSTRAFYNAMMQKNQVNEGQHQFRKRMDYTFSKAEPAFSTYIKYKLFSDTPHSKEEATCHWKDILIWESAN